MTIPNMSPLGQDAVKDTRQYPDISLFSESSKGWSTCVNVMRDHDDSMVKRWNEELDTLLVFTGLISAVITAFIIESYKLLQEDSTQTTVNLLAHVALQLTNASEFSGSTASTGASIYAKPFERFEPSAMAVRLNTLWFLSLVLALIAALFSLIVKQWIREYLKWTLISNARDAAVLRQARYDALDRWLVLRVVGGLPILVQSAVLLFLVGLIDLLWSLNDTTAIIVTTVVITCISIALGSALIPVFHRRCPYKSGLAWLSLEITNFLSRYFWNCADLLLSFISPASKRYNGLTLQHTLDPFESWRKIEMHGLQVRTQSGSLYERRALLWAHTVFGDDTRYNSIVQCLREMSHPRNAVEALFEILARDLQASTVELKSSVVQNSVKEDGNPLPTRTNERTVRQFKMAIIVVNHIWDTWDFDALVEGMKLLRTLWVRRVATSDHETLSSLMHSCIGILARRRLELHSTANADQLLQLAATCLYDLLEPVFSTSEHDDYQTALRNILSVSDVRSLICAVQNIYNSPRAVAQRESFGLAADDRLPFLTSMVALLALISQPLAHKNIDVVSELKRAQQCMQSMLNTAQHTRILDPFMQGFGQVLCLLGEHDESCVLSDLISAVYSHCGRLEYKGLGARLQKLLIERDPSRQQSLVTEVSEDNRALKEDHLA